MAEPTAPVAPEAHPLAVIETERGARLLDQWSDWMLGPVLVRVLRWLSWGALAAASVAFGAWISPYVSDGVVYLVFCLGALAVVGGLFWWEWERTEERS